MGCRRACRTLASGRCQHTSASAVQNKIGILLAVSPAQAEIHLDFALPLARHPREGGDPATLLFQSLEGKAFRALRESLFFERQRKVTKRKPPCVAPHDGAVGFASRPGISGRHILCLGKRRTSLCAAPAGVCLAGLPRLTGSVKRRRSNSKIDSNSYLIR